MHKAAPLTKIILTLIVACWALLINSLPALLILVACLGVLFPLSGVSGGSYKALASLSLFAALLAAMQFALGANLELSLIIGLRMLAMTGSFILLLAATRLQDITAALVRQLKVPYEYAFMFTAILRFVPDFFTDIKAVQEAQACRGYSTGGNIGKRLINYLAIVQPLVLRAITRSETMAMGLELRGFGRFAAGGYGASIALTGPDYLIIACITVMTIGLIIMRFN